MRRVFAAGVAELRELQTTGGGLLVLRGRVVPVLALRALQCDDLAHSSNLLLTWPAALAGKQLVLVGHSHLTRRDAGLTAPATQILSFVPGSEAVRPRIRLVLLCTKDPNRESS